MRRVRPGVSYGLLSVATVVIVSFCNGGAARGHEINSNAYAGTSLEGGVAAVTWHFSPVDWNRPELFECVYYQVSFGDGTGWWPDGVHGSYPPYGEVYPRIDDDPAYRKAADITFRDSGVSLGLNHVFADEGTYSGTLRTWSWFVNPQNGYEHSHWGGQYNWAVYNVTFQVLNVAPTITGVTGETTGEVNELFEFTALATDPGIYDVLTYGWDLDQDGLYDDYTGSLLQWSSAIAGIYELGLRVSDGDGGLAFHSFEVTVESVPEPLSVIFFGTGISGLLGTAALRRRKGIPMTNVHTRLHCIAVVALLALVFGSGIAVAAQYSIVEFDVLPGSNPANPTRAADINNLGEAVGGASGPGGFEYPFLYREGVMTNLSEDDLYASFAHAINSNGLVVGGSYRGFGFLWDEGSITVISSAFGGEGCGANDVNNLGMVAGQATDADSYARAFLWTQAGGMVNLGTLGGSESNAMALSDSGQVIGYSTDSTGYDRAFLWTEDLGITDLGTLGGESSRAWGINGNGQIVGESETNPPGSPNPTHAFVYSVGDAVWLDIGSLGGSWSCAYDISNSGLVVGSSRTIGDAATHAFLYRNEVMMDLNDMIPAGSGWILEAAYGVNNAGWIVGTGTNAEGRSRGFLLQPVPEPVSLIFFGTGLAGIVGFVTRKRLGRI